MSENDRRFNARVGDNRQNNTQSQVLCMSKLPPIAPDQPVLIAGPTASGKSALALEIAARHGGVIVNADAIQVFENWRVLTARPSKEDEAAGRKGAHS